MPVPIELSNLSAAFAPPFPSAPLIERGVSQKGVLVAEEVSEFSERSFSSGSPLAEKSDEEFLTYESVHAVCRPS